MNQKLIALGTGLLFTGAAFAVTPTTLSFPEMFQMPASQEMPRSESQMQRAPLNPNKDKGTKIFAHTRNGFDYDLTAHYLDFYSKEPQKLNKLASCILTFGNRWDRDNPRMLGPVAGVWAGDAYYTHRIVYYSLGITRLNNWVKVDPETGYSEQLQLLNESGYDPKWWQIPQALLWNPNDPEPLYAMVRNDDGSITSVIYTVDKATGEYKSKVATLSQYYMAAAYNYENQLMALRWEGDEEGNNIGTRLDVLDPEDNFRVISSTPILVNGRPYRMLYDENNLTCDYATGELWWSAWGCLDGEEEFTNNYIIKIDPLNGATENIGTVGIREGLDGLYVPYGELGDNINAPARVENLNFTKDANGDNKVTLSWDNPATRWNRRPLSNLSEVWIYRDSYSGEPVAKLPATGKEGKPMTYVDEGASNGVHKYYVVPVNAKGRGVPRNIDAFVGRDVPGPVMNVVATTTDGKSVQLSWDIPERGDNDGWYDASDLSYTITRMPDKVEVGTVKTTNFSDNTMGEANYYSYSVVASNGEGKGSAAVSNAVLAGTGIRPPFSTLFESKAEASRFSTIDKNRDGSMFEYTGNSHIMRETFALLMSNGENDDILVTPTLLLEKGKTYKVTYNEYFGGMGSGSRESVQSVRIVGGTSPTAEGMTDILFEDLERNIQFSANGETYTAYFKSPVDGEYYVGYELLTKNEADMWLYIEGFSIEEVPADDLAAESIDGHLYLSTIENNLFTVKIYNNGENKQSNYSVKLAYLGNDKSPVVFAETDIVPEIESHQTDYVEIEATVPVLGAQTIVAIVALEGDGNPSNDMTEGLLANCEEVPALNVTVEDVTTAATQTNLPLNHFMACTASQTIYTPDVTFFDRIYKGKTPQITRIAWEYKSLEEFIPFDGTKVSVYLSQTDLTGYGRSANFIPVTDAPLFEDYVAFYNGRNYMVVDFEEGYKFDPTRPLVVTVAKEESEHQQYLLDWSTFNGDWGAELYPSMRYQGGSAFDPAKPSGVSMAYAPLIHLSVNTGESGVDEIVLGGDGAVYYNAATASVESLDFEMTSVEVYDLSGKLIKTVAVAEGANSAYIGCDKGIYLLKVNGAESVFTLKVRI